MQAIMYAMAAFAMLSAGPGVAVDEFVLAQKSGCLSCHRGAEAQNGPAFKDVAGRYAGGGSAEAAEALLARRIVAGTGPDGLGWMREGKAKLPFMPPNARVPPEDARRLAKWILDVRGEFIDFSHFVSERVAVSGAVKQPLDLDVNALRKLEQRELPVALRDGGRQMLKGVLLRDVLKQAELDVQSHHDGKKTIVVATASDGYRVVFSWLELLASSMGDGVLLILEKDGQPLADSEGRIAMVSAGDNHFGSRYLKWLKTVEVRKIID